jgi:nickel transport protein
VGHFSFCLLACLFLLSTVFAPGLSAHDLQISVRLVSPAAIVHATYAGGDPVAFAAVSIHAPDSTQEHQTGRTDARGYFSFVPDRGGAWKVSVDDELGHRVEAPVKVPEAFEGGVVEQSASGLSTVHKALIGLSLIVGLTGLFYGYRSRRSQNH